MIEERFEFTSQAKRKIFLTIGAGIVLLIIGIIMLASGSGHEPAHGGAHGGGGHAEAIHWSVRVWKDLWINSVFFTGIAIVGVFFIAFNYIAQAGWGIIIKRIPEAFGYYIPVAAVIMLVLFIAGYHSLFHWTDSELYNPKSEHYDILLVGKRGYLNIPFFIARMVIYFALWYLVWNMLRKNSIEEDLNGDIEFHNKSIFWSAIFLIVFGVTSSTSAWDWVLSMDPHFFSTMFGWYVFASWFVSGLAMITLIVITLTENGYLKMVNSSHLHDLGKFMFAFSIFWTYIWFAQFLLIYYANIPEESIYFVERLKNDVYSPIFFMNLIVNFAFPFLTLMAANAKRQALILKVVAVVILFGHWMDFYMMMTPPLLKQQGGLDGTFFFVELGSILLFAGIFFFTVLSGLTKANLVPKNHPMLEESLHHKIYL